MNTDLTYALHKDLRPDPNQPRKEFPQATLDERRENIRIHGILDPLIVRADPEKKTKWMIVEGEIRWRCAGELKLERVPIAIHEFKTDADVRAYQRVVGTQRLNLSALEEAAALGKELCAWQVHNPKFSVTDLAAQVGKSRAATYETLALLKISAPVKEALKAGKLDASKARLFATVPVAQHAELLKEATELDYEGNTMSVRTLKTVIEGDYSRQLEEAGWKMADADLLKSAGACSACPKRSGNIPGMDGSPNRCTDVKCYAEKQTQHAMRVLNEAKAKGQRVIPSEQYSKRSYTFVDATEKCYEDDKKRTWAQLASVAKLAPAVTVDRKGAAIEVFSREDKGKILTANKLKLESFGGSRASGPSAADKAKRAAALVAMQKAVTQTGLDAAADYPKLPDSFWRKLAHTVIDTDEWGLSPTHWTGRGLAYTNNHEKDRATIHGYVDKAIVQNLVGMIVQILVGDQVSSTETAPFTVWGTDWKAFLPKTETEKAKPKSGPRGSAALPKKTKTKPRKGALPPRGKTTTTLSKKGKWK